MDDFLAELVPNFLYLQNLSIIIFSINLVHIMSLERSIKIFFSKTKFSFLRLFRGAEGTILCIKTEVTKLKGTVSRDGRGYKSGLNRKVSLNPITFEAKKVIFIYNLHLKYSVLYQNIIFETTWFIPNGGVFQLAPFGSGQLTSKLSGFLPSIFV